MPRLKEKLTATDARRAICQVPGIPLAKVAHSPEETQARYARGYRMIAGFDILWLKGSAAGVRSWTILDPV